MILGALSEAGGQKYLARQALENPGPFLALVGKVLPTTLQGPNNGPVQFEILTKEQRAAQAVALVDEVFGPIIEHEPVSVPLITDGTKTIQ